MANKKVRIRPPANDYADVLHPETTASVVIEETNKRFMTDAERTKLSGVEAGANKYTHPTGTNPHGTTKADVGLENAENKSSVTIRGEITSANVTSALGFTPLNNAIKGKPSGVAELDSGGKVPSAQLPSYVDDVLEFNTFANFPTVGEAGKIYVSIGTNLAYRWSGSAYTVISPSLALGETTATAYRGDRGKTAYDHSLSGHAPVNAQKNSDITKAEIEAKLTGEINTHNHVISNATTSASGLMSSDDKTKLNGVEAGANKYVHPAGTNPHSTTKADVGLSNVDNVKQMPISGGVLENYREKLITVSPVYGTINLPLGNVFQHTPNVNTTYTIYDTTAGKELGQGQSFTLIINQPASAKTLTFPASVKWRGGETPDLSNANKTYVLTFMSVDGGTTWLGMFEGEF